MICLVFLHTSFSQFEPITECKWTQGVQTHVVQGSVVSPKLMLCINILVTLHCLLKKWGILIPTYQMLKILAVLHGFKLLFET